MATVRQAGCGQGQEDPRSRRCEDPGRPEAPVQPGPLRPVLRRRVCGHQAQLEEGGLFKVDLQSTEWTQFNKDRVVTEDSDGSYPVYQLGWFPDYSDPDNYLSPFFRDGNFVNNGYSNKEVNDLIVKQAGETDAKAREDLLKEIQKLETDDLSTIAAAGCPGCGHRF